jgi:hypothetical protein
MRLCRALTVRGKSSMIKKSLGSDSLKGETALPLEPHSSLPPAP